jgi:ATP-dependent RNA helicase RhlB
MQNKELSDITFASLGLPESLQSSLDEAGFTHCTPIQAESLPIALNNRDVAGQAQTGTGKTAAFLLATMSRLMRNPPAESRRPNDPRALILAPTRELAAQIDRDAKLLGKNTGLKHLAVYGGTGYDQQRNAFDEGVDILIGTPGRLIDFCKQGVFGLKSVEVMVVDEADRMFDLGFIKDVRYLLRRTPPPEQRLGLLFSATLSWRVTELAYEHMNNAEMVVIDPKQVTATNVTEVLYHVSVEEKVPLLLGYLSRVDPHRTIIFVNTKYAAGKVWGYLEGNGYSAAVLSGDIPQKKRLSLLRRFQDGELPVLVATDVAARGLHIENVSHVINFDLPQDAEDYVHRIGRTARLGAEGDAISLACDEYVYSLPDIQKYIGHNIPVADVEEGMLLTPKPPKRLEKEYRPQPGKGRGRSSSSRGGGQGRSRRG